MCRGGGGELCETEEGDELGDPDDNIGVGRVGAGDEDVREFWRLGRAEGRCCEDALKKGRLGFVEGDFVLLGKVVVESGNVATDDVG